MWAQQVTLFSLVTQGSSETNLTPQSHPYLAATGLPLYLRMGHSLAWI